VLSSLVPREGFRRFLLFIAEEVGFSFFSFLLRVEASRRLLFFFFPHFHAEYGSFSSLSWEYRGTDVFSFSMLFLLKESACFLFFFFRGGDDR